MEKPEGFLRETRKRGTLKGAGKRGLAQSSSYFKLFSVIEKERMNRNTGERHFIIVVQREKKANKQPTRVQVFFLGHFRRSTFAITDGNVFATWDLCIPTSVRRKPTRSDIAPIYGLSHEPRSAPKRARKQGFWPQLPLTDCCSAEKQFVHITV